MRGEAHALLDCAWLQGGALPQDANFGGSVALGGDGGVRGERSRSWLWDGRRGDDSLEVPPAGLTRCLETIS